MYRTALILLTFCLMGMPTDAMRITGQKAKSGESHARDDGRNKRQPLLDDVDFFAQFFDEETSSDVSSDDCCSSDEAPLQTSSVITFANHRRSERLEIPDTLDDEIKVDPEPAENDDDQMYQRGNTCYFVNKNGLIVSKITGDGDLINVAHKNEYWDDEKSKSDDESDDESDDDEIATQEFDLD